MVGTTRQRGGRARQGFSLLEVTLTLAAVALLLAILIPALSAARLAGFKQQCAGNQRIIGEGWLAYLREHDDFPGRDLDNAAWVYGGVRFSAADGKPFLDFERPLNRYLPVKLVDGSAENLFLCPADTGITDSAGQTGTGKRSAYRAFGTSYRANSRLLDARLTGIDAEARGLKLAEVSAPHAETVVMGTPAWFEVLAHTGRSADWFGVAGAGNMLFLDGSVRFITIDPDSRRITAMFDPVATSQTPDPAFPGAEGPASK